MNGIAFDESEKGNKFDANFIAIMNKDKGIFDYYVQRLLGVGVENEEEPTIGKIWVPYINNKREDWSYLCENNRIIAKEDDIIWRFELFDRELNPDINDVGSTNSPMKKGLNSKMSEPDKND